MSATSDNEHEPGPIPEVSLTDPVVADILSVATREFAQHGLSGARIERIQDQTRTSKRMIYYHFGSKEGLYRAVLEHAFTKARAADQSFDPQAGSPEVALRGIARNAFAAFVHNPDFVRLLTFENLSGASFIRESQHVAQFNRRALADLQEVLQRGQADGSFRCGIDVMDVYINIVGLCYYHVAHQAGYRAGGFDDAQARRIQGQAFDEQRQKAIEEACWRFVRA